MKNTVSINWKHQTAVIFNTLSGDKKCEVPSKLQQLLSIELRRNKNIFVLFECLVKSLPHVDRIERWIRQRTIPNPRNFYENWKFMQKNATSPENLDIMYPGDVTMIPRTPAHVRLVFFSKYAIDFKFKNDNTIILEGL